MVAPTAGGVNTAFAAYLPSPMFRSAHSPLSNSSLFARPEPIMRDMDSATIAVRVTSRARASEIAGERDGLLLARVRAPPTEGRANAELCRLIAKRAGVGVRNVTVVRGASSREKVVRVEGIDADELGRRLAPSGG